MRLARIARVSWSASLIAAGFAVACSGGGTDTPPSTSNPTGPTGNTPTPVLTALQVSLSPSTITPGQTSAATAAGRDQFGAVIATGPIAWGSSAAGVATVSAAGTITGVASGVSTITATSGSITASAQITVSAAPLAIAACKLPARFTDLGLGFPRVASRLKAVGDVRMPMVFVDFSDAVATRTPQAVSALISPQAENYYRAVSYGRMNLILEPNHVWRRMSRPTTGYGWGALNFDLHRTYIMEALTLADAAVDYSQADGFVVVSNPDAGALSNGPAFVAGPGFGVTFDGRTILNGSTSGRDLTGWGAYWLNHEAGHNLGLPDLYPYSGGGQRFVGGFSLMGHIGGFAREFFGWERWLLGWLDDAQVTCAGPGASEAVLSPIERIGGMKMIVVPIGTTSAVVVESRRAEGFDTNGAWTPGVVAYFIDTAIGSGQGALKVLPINDGDTSKGTVALLPGGTLIYNGVTITFVSQDASGDRVRVSR